MPCILVVAALLGGSLFERPLLLISDQFLRTNSMINMLILYVVSTGETQRIPYVGWARAESVPYIGFLIW